MKKLLLILFLSVLIPQFVRSQVADSSSAKDSAVAIKEEMPKAPYDFNAFLSQNMKYPADAKAAGKTGKVYVAFTVEKNGSISSVAVRKSSGTPSLDAEAVRVISMMPPWTPGNINGRPVRVEVVQPITFDLVVTQPAGKKKKHNH